MDSKEGVKDIYRNIRLRFTMLPENLKDKQIDLLFAIINGKNTFGILPMGFGKSLVYSIAALMLDMVSFVFTFRCIMNRRKSFLYELL